MNQALENITAELNARFGLEGSEQFTFGYIGGVHRGWDDRSFKIFGAHPNRVGTYKDSFGGFNSIEDLVRVANLKWETLLRWAADHVATNNLGAKS